MTVRVRIELARAAGRQHATATTLGGGGLFVETEELWERLTPVAIRFRLRDDGPLHALRGRVVFGHSASDGIGSKTGMGIEFTDPDATARLAAELERLP
jgi:Tfp pilus assembly protein PilZ